MTSHLLTVPLYERHNRPCVVLDFNLGNSSSRKAYCLLDTGGGAIVVTEHLAKEMSLPLKGNHRGLAMTRLPQMSLGSLSLNTSAIQAGVALGQTTIAFEHAVEVLCGAPLLGQYHLIFDYPHHQFTLALPGQIDKHIGVELPLGIHSQSKFPRIEIEIDGVMYGMLLDTGAACTMVSEAIIDRWMHEHPDWPETTGAMSIANFHPEADSTARMMRLPIAHWGPYQIEGMCVVSRPEGVFEKTLSQWMDRPIIGALGGNVLKYFRCEINYQEKVLYLEQHASSDADEMNGVGLTLQPHPCGAIISHISPHSHCLTQASVRIGDKILSIDRKKIAGLPLFQVMDMLDGKSGEQHALQIERNGEQLELVLLVIRPI